MLEIKTCKDCWGCTVYYGYKDGKQYTDFYDCKEELIEDYPEFNY